ncbi:glycosyltransferase [Arthrobacter subterraneus]|uniref:glycosyltransferase n=1 Tax=Arthrobacter subterraneus TaxID=335973 RepID=UPI000B809AE1
MVEASGVICIAVYRPSWDLLVEQLRSIQRQTVNNWLAIIGIDGLDEDLRSRLQDFIGEDVRFTVRQYQERVGHYRNFERLLAEVGSEYQWIALADQDDHWYPEKLERMVPGLRDYDLVCSQARVVSIDGASRAALGTTSRSNASLAAMFINNRVTGSFSLLSPRLVRAALPFPAPTDQAFHDHWLGVCARSADRLTFIDDVLQDYHQHGSNVIGEEGKDSLIKRFSRLRSKAGASNTGGGARLPLTASMGLESEYGPVPCAE